MSISTIGLHAYAAPSNRLGAGSYGGVVESIVYQKRNEQGQYASELGIDAHGRSAEYQRIYNRMWLGQVFADPEKLAHLRQRRQRNTEAWRKRNHERKTLLHVNRMRA